MSRTTKTIRRAALVAGGFFAGRAIVRRRKTMEAVPADLHSPIMWMPLTIASDRTLGVVRSLQGRAPQLPPVEGVEVTERTIERPDGPPIRVLVHEPDGRSRPSGALLWIHGGGYILGVPEQSNPIASALAKELGIVVAAVDYRLAPDDPFPAGLDDCMVTLAWLHDQADELGVDRGRIAVGGDSAGGGLAAAVAQRAHDDGEHALAFQALLYPMLDDRTALRADDEGRGQFLWTAKSNTYAWGAYLGHIPGVDDPRPYAAPGRRDDLSGLAPAWIGVGDLDLFYLEDVDYAERLEAAGVPCRLHVVPGMYHATENFVPDAPAMQEFRSELIAALREPIGSVPADTTTVG